MAALVSMANLLAKASRLSCGGDRMAFILADQDAWKVLRDRGLAVDSLDIERITFEMETIGDQVKSYITTVMEPSGKEPSHG
jgi:hypothetical protein